MESKNLNFCKLSILKTLSYSGVFNYPLSIYQIYTNLVTNRFLPAKKIKKELKILEKEGFVSVKDGRYLLSNTIYDMNKEKESVNWKEREKRTKEFVKENEDVLKKIIRIPWVRMCAITGSSANYNIDDKADIDLFFVTRKNRVWLTRGLVFLILAVLNKLPKNHSERKICPNIFIDERCLSWLKKKRNLYIAQNIVSMQPILDRENTYFRFLNENKWIKKYFSNFKISFALNLNQPKSSRSSIVNLIEKISMTIQLIYMKRKRSKEIANSKLIHFNKNDNGVWILPKYKKILKNTIKIVGAK